MENLKHDKFTINKCAFWRWDEFTKTLALEQKAFYKYLFENPDVTACGIYKFLGAIACEDLSISRRKVIQFLHELANSDRVLFVSSDNFNGELMIVKYMKNHLPSNPNMLKRIETSINSVCSEELKEKWIKVNTPQVVNFTITKKNNDIKFKFNKEFKNSETINETIDDTVSETLEPTVSITIAEIRYKGNKVLRYTPLTPQGGIGGEIEEKKEFLKEFQKQYEVLVKQKIKRKISDLFNSTDFPKINRTKFFEKQNQLKEFSDIRKLYHGKTILAVSRDIEENFNELITSFPKLLKLRIELKIDELTRGEHKLDLVSEEYIGFYIRHHENEHIILRKFLIDKKPTYLYGISYSEMMKYFPESECNIINK